jgi:hypothetical protein
MKRYRISNFMLNTSRNLFLEGTSESPWPKDFKEEVTKFMAQKYGESFLDEKLKRYTQSEAPNISIYGEYTHLLSDASDAYISGYLYSSLTAACCLGERIFNDIIFKVMNDFKSSEYYKIVYQKARRGGSIIDWPLAIEILIGYKYTTESGKGTSFIINDPYPYENKEISDEEFVRLRIEHKGK